MYQALRASRSEFVPIRQLQYHVRIWGQPVPGEAPLVMVHGWMDVSASYQFVVDALSRDRWVIAPDWRGYGQTRWGQTDNYWIADYLADLDFLLDHYSPQQPVDLVGHSLGGNVVMHYAGVRPDRIRRLVNLEGFGMPVTRPAQAPGRYAQWMDQLKALHRGELALRPYDSLDGVAGRLMKTNPRLGADKAQWLAAHWAGQNAQGQWEILGDPAHKIVNAHLFQVEEALELYRRIQAPVLFVEADHNSLNEWWKGRFTLEEFHQRLKVVPTLRCEVIREAGHMLHHDQPDQLARLIEDFIA